MAQYYPPPKGRVQMTRRDHADKRSASTPERHGQGPADKEFAREAESSELLADLQRRAAGLQHAMNNPLAALLAEGQLLMMEDTLSTDQRESVDRMIELTRRVIAQVRNLDELRGVNPPR
jgi:signal transduction histidine kinase